MLEYLSDVEESDDDFEYDGRPYRFEPEYKNDEERFERRMQRERAEQLEPENKQPLHVHEWTGANWWCCCGRCTATATVSQQIMSHLGASISGPVRYYGNAVGWI